MATIWDNTINNIVNGIKALINNHNTNSNSHSSLFDAKVNVSDVKDNLTSTDTNKPLSANQGKVLKGLVDGKADSIHNHKWTDINDWIVGKQKEGDILLLDPTVTDSVIENVLFANGILDYDINEDIVIFDKNRFTSNKYALVVDRKDIVNNLTTTGSDKVLDARQGKVLNDKFNDYLTTANASSTYVAKDGNKVLSTNDFTDSYKGQLDNLSSTIANAVGNLELFEIVQALPTTDIKNNKLYLVPNSVDGTTNEYDIYIRVNNNWEKIDSLDFDINDYIKKTNSTNLLLANGTNIQQSTFAVSGHNHNDTYYTETEIDNLLDSKADSSDIPDVSGFITQSSITTHNTDNNAHTDIRNSIPTKVSDLTNDSNYISTSNTNGLIRNNGSIDTNTYLTSQDITGKANTSDLSTVATSGSYNDLLNKPSTFTPSSHTHGNIDNNGLITQSKVIQDVTVIDYDNFIISDGNDNGNLKNVSVINFLNRIVLDLINEGEE